MQGGILEKFSEYKADLLCIYVKTLKNIGKQIYLNAIFHIF